MKNWRDVLIKKSMQEIPITIDLLKNNGLVEKDYVSPKIDVESIDGTKICLEGQVYEIIRITKVPLGLTINSEIGPWFLSFPESANYFMQNFVKVILNEADQLSRNFDVIPNEILTLLFEHGPTPRATVRRELVAQGFDGKLIQKALVYLEKHEYVRASSKLGTIELTEKGKDLLQGKE